MMLGAGYEALKWWMTAQPKDKEEPAPKMLPLKNADGQQQSTNPPDTLKFMAVRKQAFQNCHRTLAVVKLVR